MTHRNYDWSPLGVWGDPVPGDPAYIARRAGSMRTSADAMLSAAHNLRRLEAPSTCSEAITKILVQSTKTAELLSEAGARYHSAATALSAYAPALTSAQAESLAALQQAGPSRATEQAAYKKSLGLYWQAKATLDPVEREHLIHQYHRAKAQQDQASGSLNAAKARLHEAIESRDAAAVRAADSVDAASTGGKLNDSAWDKFADFVEPLVDAVDKVGAWIWKHIDEISLVLTIAAIALAWVPGLNAVLAGLAMGARVLSAAKAGYALVAGVAQGLRTGQWGGAAMGAAGLLLSIVGGKAVGTLAKKAGALVGKKVTAGVTKALTGYNAWLRKVTTIKYNHLQHLILKSQNDGARTVARALRAGRTTPYYRRSAGEIAKMHGAANASVRAKAADADAVLATVKGSDYTNSIKEAAEDLAKFGKHHDLADSMIREVAEDTSKAAAVAAQKAVKEAGGHVVNEAANWVDERQKQLESHRLSTTPCGAR